ncbi:MAG: tRNA (adenosine(37)-N6)-dimethylallyltransferase MiaA [Bacteroidales bacterium]|nr:tRNA (adenosine(37)-N6)-dimethylallyltransferase MiaA [Bacteroidales bacterium]
MIAIIGPTATGKTSLATHFAARHNGEVISADSRQVYRGMDIGTGKDLSEYSVAGQNIPYHLINIADPGEEYNVYRYQQDFLNSYKSIISEGKTPVLCGGTGMYIDAVLKGYRLFYVPENQELRTALKHKSIDELRHLLKQYKTPHNTTDTIDRGRLMRAIEIQDYYTKHAEKATDFPDITTLIFGISFDRPVIRERITTRLRERLDNGMIEEVEALLNKGIPPESLKFYGLEYRYLTQYILHEISYHQMFSRLNTAIHQFAKRQTTWFRKMEKQGFTIHWIDGQLPLENKINEIEKIAEPSL